MGCNCKKKSTKSTTKTNTRIVKQGGKKYIIKSNG